MVLKKLLCIDYWNVHEITFGCSSSLMISIFSIAIPFLKKPDNIDFFFLLLGMHNLERNEKIPFWNGISIFNPNDLQNRCCVVILMIHWLNMKDLLSINISKQP